MDECKPLPDEVLHVFSPLTRNASAGGGGIPAVLQVYMPPAHGLRYCVSYAYEGTSMAARMEVTARSFAARYPPNPTPCAAEAMAAATAIQSTAIHGASLAEDMGGRGGLREWVAPPTAVYPHHGPRDSVASNGSGGEVAPSSAIPPRSGAGAAAAARAAIAGYTTAAGSTVVPPGDAGIAGARVRAEMRKVVWCNLEHAVILVQSP